MADISFSPSKTQDQALSHSPSPRPIKRLPATHATGSHSQIYHPVQTGTDGCISSQPDDQEPFLIGGKRNRHQDDHEPAFSPHSNASNNDPVAAIVRWTKKLRISNRAVDDRDREVRQTRTKPDEKPEVEIVHQDATPGVRFLVQPSFVGLPEELVIEIILDGLDFFDIMALRQTQRRVSSITRARVIWMMHFYRLLSHMGIPESPATVLPSLLSTPSLERIVLRPHVFVHKWFRGVTCRQSPDSSQILSAGWSAPQDLRFPHLLPGGRWLVAISDDERSWNSGVCLWDLDHGKLKWLPEAQMEADGTVLSVDVKLDPGGSFALLAILSEKINVAMAHVFRVDVYKINLAVESGDFGFLLIDSLQLNDRSGCEVQIYVPNGYVLVDLFDRVLVWAFSPANKCAWILTSKTRHQRRRFSHRSAHAITLTHTSILVADGDENAFRAFHIPELSERPAQLGKLLLYMLPPYFEHHLPPFSISLRFSADCPVRLPNPVKPSPNDNADTAGAATSSIPAVPSVEDAGESTPELCSNPLGRGVLYIDAAPCSSYVFCSYPIHDISPHADSPNALLWTSRERGDVREEAGFGARSSQAESISASFRPFIVRSRTGSRSEGGRGGDALWVGTVGDFGSSPTANDGIRNLVLMRSAYDSGGMMILSVPIPPQVDLAPGQTRIAEVEQGRARTVLWQSYRENIDVAGRVVGDTHVEEATVDQISGRVCVVETVTSTNGDPARPISTTVRCALRLLEYA